MCNLCNEICKRTTTPSIIDKIQTVGQVEGIEALGPDYFIELNKQTGPGLGIKQQDSEIIYHKGKQSKKETKK